MSLSPIEKAASGALASAISNTLVYPLDLSKTIIQTQVKTHAPASTVEPPSSSSSNESSMDRSLLEQEQKNGEMKYKNTTDVLRKIYEKKGVLGWYHGLVSSIFGSAVQNFSYFYWYTIVKRSYLNLHKHQPNHKPSTAIELLLGALAAAISQLFTMPIGVVTTQKQTDHSSKNTFQLIKDILDQDGVSGLWRGLRVSLVLCINPSITYGSYERLKLLLYGTKEFLGPLESFLIGVLAKSMATFVTQPLIVSKALLQKKTPSPDHKAKPEDNPAEQVKFQHFTEALSYLWKTEKMQGLYKGIGPQLLKGVFVQGLLFMFKDQIDILFLVILKIIKTRKPLKR